MNTKPRNKLNLRSAFSLLELSIVILVIGIVVAGITQSSRLVEQFRITSARSLTRSAPISAMKGLSLWLETVSETSFLNGDSKDGRIINKWLDINPQSSSKAHATASGGVKYKTGCFNSLPCLSFIANSTLTVDTNSFPKSQDAPPIIDNFTVFVVTQKSTANGPILNSTNTGPSSVGLTIAGNNALQVTKEAVGSSSVTTVPSLIKPSIIQLDVRQDGSALFYVNGGSSLTAASGFGSLLSPTGVIGGGSFVGYISEVIVFSRVIPKDERDAVTDYLTKKWGIK